MGHPPLLCYFETKGYAIMRHPLLMITSLNVANKGLLAHRVSYRKRATIGGPSFPVLLTDAAGLGPPPYI